jgi:hypothetical protein
MTGSTSIDAQAVCVYGIVAADAVDDADLPEGTRALRSGPLAAVVSTSTPDARLASDLRRHDTVVGALVERGVTVAPVRFGTVANDPDTLKRDLLDAHREGLLGALDTLAGRVQYTLRVYYVRDAVVRAAMRDDPRIAASRDGSERSQGAQLELGQRVVAAIDRRRPSDAQRIQSELESHAERVHCEPGRDPDRLANFSCLVERSAIESFERSLEALAERHHAAVSMTLVGPLAPYDFVPEF